MLIRRADSKGCGEANGAGGELEASRVMLEEWIR